MNIMGTVWVLREVFLDDDNKHLLGVYATAQEAFDAYDAYLDKDPEGTGEVDSIVINDPAEYRF